MIQPIPDDKLSFQLNGKRLELNASPSRRVIDILREDLELTGTKISCEIGRCGACMILLDGQPVNACLLMAYQLEGRSVVTIEGLAEGDDLHPVQQAFLEEGGFQCGYCTPGMVISLVGLLGVNPTPTHEELTEGLSGNICRCTGYGGIMRAAETAVRNCCRATGPT
ncbi:2Fe-2S iron-sulfur cluster binding domain-containing protein [Paenibacillus sp. LMG 31456]|uniref:2Fe-2S iron-sulfur cluster binding domain-containing protein n=1 Tax=Paenibacillus foliorum TaxID=2654974 RepID=A0A972GQ79_9BACL|nr:(2Fe-2S)-binding protein [Paenibacillus foliorum]NOU92208.1 2Fe-2S iron-sulfur cluster binding domain-containing protein [Paenibacillus foliorum]